MDLNAKNNVNGSKGKNNGFSYDMNLTVKGTADNNDTGSPSGIPGPLPTGDTPEIPDCMEHLLKMYTMLDMHKKAYRCYVQSVLAKRKIKNDPIQSLLIRAGWALSHGNFKEAVKLLLQVLREFIGDHTLTGEQIMELVKDTSISLELVKDTSISFELVKDTSISFETVLEFVALIKALIELCREMSA